MITRCEHDDIVIINSKYACEVCGAAMPGNPADDLLEYLEDMKVEDQLMESLGK